MSSRGVRPGHLAAVIAGILVIAGLAAAVFLRPMWPGAASPVFSVETTPTLAGAFPAAGSPRLRNPLGIAVVGRRVYVAESDAAAVRVFEGRGKEVVSLAVPAAPGTRAAYPADVAAFGEGRLAVLDTAGSRVLSMRADDGRVLGMIGSAEASVPLRQPTALASGDGELYVADAGDHTIKVYGGDGKLKRTLASSLRPSLTFVGGMAVAERRLWVSDSNAGRIVALDPRSGAQVAVLPDAFSLPRGLAIAPEGSILLVDAFAHTIRSYDCSLTAGFTLSRVSDNGDLRSPRGIAYDASAGRAFVTDAGAGVVRVYSFATRR